MEPFDEDPSAPRCNEHPLKWVTKQVMAASSHSDEDNPVAETDLLVNTTTNDLHSEGSPFDASKIYPDCNVGEVTILTSKLAETAQLNEPFVPRNALPAFSPNEANGAMSIVPSEGSSDDPMIPNVMNAKEATNILVAMNESSEQLEVTDTEWSDTWNIELDSLFKMQSLEPVTSQASEKKMQTGHHAQSSNES